MVRTLAERTWALDRLIAYVRVLANGELILYADVQRDARVEMDTKGRALLRQAIELCGQTCSPIPKIGYRLSDAESSLHGQALRRDGRVWNAISRVLREERLELERHSDSYTLLQRQVKGYRIEQYEEVLGMVGTIRTKVQALNGIQPTDVAQSAQVILIPVVSGQR